MEEGPTVVLANRAATKQWVRARVQHYAQNLSLGYRPRVVFTLAAWLAVGGHKNELDVDARGATSVRIGAIYINIEKHLRTRADWVSRTDVDDTCAHEVMHLRFPSRTHDRKGQWQRGVTAVRFGMRCGPKHARLPEELRPAG